MFRSARRREALRRPLRDERGGGILCRHAHSLFILLNFLNAIILAATEILNGDILVPAYRGCPRRRVV